jgi:hypothetical protein
MNPVQHSKAGNSALLGWRWKTMVRVWSSPDFVDTLMRPAAA